MTIRTKDELIALFPDNTAGIIAPEYVRDIVDSVCQWCRPVGSIYETTLDEDPAVTFGFGTWERIAVGRVIVGVDPNDPDFDAVGKTGGSKAVTLTEAQIPAHGHSVDDPGHSHVEQNNGTTTGPLTGWGARDTSTNSPGATGYSTLPANTGISIGNAGGGQAHSNMPPFYAAYTWRRVA